MVLSFDESKDIRLGTKNTEPIELLSAELARIHSLSVADAQQLEIQSFTPTELNSELVAEIDRLSDTGKVPGVLLSRWEKALEGNTLDTRMHRRNRLTTPAMRCKRCRAVVDRLRPLLVLRGCSEC